MNVVFVCEGANLALRMRPAASGNPPRITPPEGMTVAGHFIHGNVFIFWWDLISRPSSAALCGLCSTMSGSSRIQIRLFLRDGSNQNVGTRAVWKTHGSHLDMASGVVLENRSRTFWNCANRSLAMMVIRVTIAKLIWNYDIGLNSSEPLYDHKSLSAGKLDVSLKLFEREWNCGNQGRTWLRFEIHLEYVLKLEL